MDTAFARKILPAAPVKNLREGKLFLKRQNSNLKVYSMSDTIESVLMTA